MSKKKRIKDSWKLPAVATPIAEINKVKEYMKQYEIPLVTNKEISLADASLEDLLHEFHKRWPTFHLSFSEEEAKE